MLFDGATLSVEIIAPRLRRELLARPPVPVAAGGPRSRYGWPCPPATDGGWGARPGPAFHA